MTIIEGDVVCFLYSFADTLDLDLHKFNTQDNLKLQINKLIAQTAKNFEDKIFDANNS